MFFREVTNQLNLSAFYELPPALALALSDAHEDIACARSTHTRCAKSDQQCPRSASGKAGGD